MTGVKFASMEQANRYKKYSIDKQSVSGTTVPLPMVEPDISISQRHFKEKMTRVRCSPLGHPHSLAKLLSVDAALLTQLFEQPTIPI